MEILQISNLCKTYPNGVQALKGVSFTVNNGEFVSIIGPSGSGKSTLLRCINRLVDATEGDIRFLDWDVTKAHKKDIKEIRKNVGMIFQHYNLVYRLNALENVLHGRLGYYPIWKSIFGLFTNEDIQHAVELLGLLGLEDKLYQRCANLSGGQKQRVGIARALIQKPKMVLCDEPIASLDPQSSKVIMDYLQKITHKMGIPCLVNLHQVEVAKRYSDRIIGVRLGEVVFDGSPSDLSEDVISEIYGVAYDQLIATEEA